jgi:hypothetical protein
VERSVDTQAVQRKPVNQANPEAKTSKFPWGRARAPLRAVDTALFPLGLLHKADVGIGVKANSSSSRAPDRPAQRS